MEKYFEERVLNIYKYFDPRLKQFERVVRSNGGNVNILNLSEELNISKRQLERNVLNSIGLTPKEFCRVVRFQKVLHIKQNNKFLNCTDLAYSSGFSDQAHFISDFKSISGFTPNEYFKIADSFSDYYSYN